MIIALVVVAVIAIVIIVLYNGLVSKRNAVKNAFAGIDVQLKKRYDLIPNLVETVQQYCKHEESVLTSITKYRTGNFDQLSADEKIQMEEVVKQATKAIHVAVEQYPDLKASANFDQLQRSLNETEEQLSAARRFYNSCVTELNISIESFPTNLLAQSFGFTKEELFKAEEVERQAVNVKDLFQK